MLTWFLNLLGFKKKNIGKGVFEDYEPIRSEETRLNSSHKVQSRMPSSA